MCTVHDVVRTDPEGRKYLFVNQTWTALIIGLSQEGSDALHAEINSISMPMANFTNTSGPRAISCCGTIAPCSVRVAKPVPACVRSSA